MVPPDLYISVDIEADGPIPGAYSMLSYGLVVAGRFDGHLFEPANPLDKTLYCELQPISSNYDREAMKINRLDREYLRREGEPAPIAMNRASEWITQVAGDDQPILVGFPLVFDWMFFYWYLQRFAASSPITFSSGLDMKTMYQQKARVPLGKAGLDDLPSLLKPSKPHTHNALDDAIEQAEIFIRLFRWSGNS